MQQDNNTLKIFAAPPLSAYSNDIMCVSQGNSLKNKRAWRLRCEVADNAKADVKNEILTSDDILEKERFEIDLLKVNNIFYLGKKISNYLLF